MPNSIINEEDLLKILELPILVVLDEAYIEFSGIESKMSWVKKFDNLIVLRTFSKRAGTFLFFFHFVGYSFIIPDIIPSFLIKTQLFCIIKS